jgi:hypothetical protein
MQTLQFFDPDRGSSIFYISLLWISIVVAKGCHSCWKTVKESGWREARSDVVFTVILAGLLVFLISAAAFFFQWLVSRGSYYAITFDRDYVVLRFEWPTDDVVLKMTEVHGASFSDKWFGTRHRGRLTIESTKGTHETSWGRNRTAMEEAAKEITKLKRKARDRREPFTDSPANLPLPAKWGTFWRVLEWTAWSIGLTAFVGSNLFLIQISPAGGLRRSAGHTFIGFSVLAFVALALTLFTQVSKLHLFWFLPVAFGASLYAAFRISAWRRNKNEEIMPGIEDSRRH